jgi:hypothetical protein
MATYIAASSAAAAGERQHRQFPASERPEDGAARQQLDQQSGVVVEPPKRTQPGRLGMRQAPGRLAASLLATVERIARADPLGHEPRNRKHNQCRWQQRPPFRRVAPQERPENDHEREQLRPQQAGEGAEHDRVFRAGVELSLHRPQNQCDGDGCLAALGRELEPVGNEEQSARGKDPGDGSGDAAPGQPPGQSERQRGHQHGQRLPGRPAGRVEVEMSQLAAPHEPCPRVVAGSDGSTSDRPPNSTHTAMSLAIARTHGTSA